MGTYSQIENTTAYNYAVQEVTTANGLTPRESYSLFQLLWGREPGTGVSQGVSPMGIFPGI